MNNLEIKKIIGDLEVMAATAEPGVVITTEMSASCNVTLLKAVNELRRIVCGDVSTKTSAI